MKKFRFKNFLEALVENLFLIFILMCLATIIAVIFYFTTWLAVCINVWVAMGVIIILTATIAALCSCYNDDYYN